VDTKVRFGRICAAIAQALPGNPSNDIMQALERELYSLSTHEHFRQQLNQYQIVSFYESIGNVRLLEQRYTAADKGSLFLETRRSLVFQVTERTYA
jgi:hypothetical protein